MPRLGGTLMSPHVGVPSQEASMTSFVVFVLSHHASPADIA